MTAKEVRHLKATLKSIEHTKTKLAALRDKLRDQTCEIEDIIQNADEAVAYLEDGKRSFDDAVTVLSQNL